MDLLKKEFQASLDFMWSRAIPAPLGLASYQGVIDPLEKTKNPTISTGRSSCPLS